MTANDARLRAKLTLRLIAPLTVLFVMNSLDRVNASFAALQMNADLGMSPEMYGFGASIFFFGYILLQAPHAMSQRVVGVRRWLFFTMLAWGLIATSMAFIQNATQFYVLRFALGVAEGGFAPGVIAYLSTWLPRRFMGWATAGTMVAIPISVIIGAPLSGWLMQMANPIGVEGWRWMFLLEGLPPVLLSVLVFKVFSARPEDARWLTTDETASLRRELDAQHGATAARGGAKLSAILANPAIWASMVIWYCLLAGSYGLMFWLPQVIKELSGGSELRVGIITALPWVGIGSGMLINAWHSDRTGERYWHIRIPAVLAAVCIVATTLVPVGPVTLVLLVAGGFCMGAAQGCFWTVPTSFLTGAALPLGITFINMCGNSAGIVSPIAIGWIRSTTGSFQAPILAMAGLMLLAALMTLPLSAWSRAAERRAAVLAAG